MFTKFVPNFNWDRVKFILNRSYIAFASQSIDPNIKSIKWGGNKRNCLLIIKILAKFFNRSHYGFVKMISFGEFQ